MSSSSSIPADGAIRPEATSAATSSPAMNPWMVPSDSSNGSKSGRESLV